MRVRAREHRRVRPVEAIEAIEAVEAVDVSVLTPVYNEERFIRDTVAAMQGQRFEGSIEFLFADGGSDDATLEILHELSVADPRIRVFHNAHRTIPAGLNLLLRQAQGHYVARMDAHTVYPPDYLRLAVDRLRRGDVTWVSGPVVPVAVDRGSRWVSLALSSRLGFGASAKWEAVAVAKNGDRGDGPDEIELDSGVFGGVWERSVVEQLGGWDEGWPRNQDSEMAGRFLAQGLRLVCLPALGARYAPRSSLRDLARQYAGYGYYRAKTAARHPATLRRTHALAPGLVVTAAMAATAGAWWPGRLALGGLGFYGAAVAGETLRVALRPEHGALGLPAVFATMHFSWGAGFIVGALRHPRVARGAPALVRNGKRVALPQGRVPEPIRRARWRHAGWVAALFTLARRRTVRR